MTDFERATALAREILGEVATAEIVAALNAAFGAVRLDERNRVLSSLRDRIAAKRSQALLWEDQLTWS